MIDNPSIREHLFCFHVFIAFFLVMSPRIRREVVVECESRFLNDSSLFLRTVCQA